jgi:phosphatidylserine decarboxylase
VLAVDEVEDPAVGPGKYRRVVTFLNVFDVHVQRVPGPGEILKSELQPGKKVAAYRADAGDVNEQQVTVLRRPNGDVVGVRQIAGLVARRVVGYLRAGDRVERGRLLGVIKFGSRVDLLVPPSYEILVRPGDRVRNGETPMARPAAAAR